MEDIVLITSVINTGNNPWSYTEKRSNFSVEERFIQTCKSIESARHSLPSVKVFLVECSELTEDYTNVLMSKCDFFLNLYSDSYVRHACLETNKKGYGEAVQTKLAIEYILENKIEFNRLFKLSGRYFFDEHFHPEVYSSETFTFKKPANPSAYPLSISTVCYSVPYASLSFFYRVLCEVVNYYKTHGPKGYEELLPILCEPYTWIDTLGVSGWVAVGELILFSG
jgi:hypothetical protein